VEEGTAVRAAGSAVQQGVVDHEDGHHLVGGVQGGQEGRVVGHPEVPANQTTARLGMAVAPGSGVGAGPR